MGVCLRRAQHGAELGHERHALHLLPGRGRVRSVRARDGAVPAAKLRLSLLIRRCIPGEDPPINAHAPTEIFNSLSLSLNVTRSTLFAGRCLS